MQGLSAMHLDNNERLQEIDRHKRQLRHSYQEATIVQVIQADIDHIMVATNLNMQTCLFTAITQDMPHTQDTIHTVNYLVEFKKINKQNRSQEQKKSLRKKRLKLKGKSLLLRQKQKSLSQRNQKRKRIKKRSRRRARKARRKEKQMRTKPIMNTQTLATTLRANG